MRNFIPEVTFLQALSVTKNFSLKESPCLSYLWILCTILIFARGTCLRFYFEEVKSLNIFICPKMIKNN